MARPRIFISSTYFDLRSIRDELDRFVSSMGYESIRHEQGGIAYGKDEPPESYAYREVEFADILVSIIGSKFGSNASGSDYSISQTELKKAYDLGKQVYIFIDEAVHSEYRFFQANKNVDGLVLTAANDKRIYAFIEEIYGLPKGNPIFGFRTGQDLVEQLRDQWAGLFQRLLTQEATKAQSVMTDQLQQSLQTVDRLIKFLQAEHENSQSALQEIVFSNHPVFQKLRDLLNTKYRLYFTNTTELNEWLVASRSFMRVKEQNGDEFYYWMKELPVTRLRKKIEYQVLQLSKELFDNQKLRSLSQGEWNDAWVAVERLSDKPSRFPEEDDDIPF